MGLIAIKLETQSFDFLALLLSFFSLFYSPTPHILFVFILILSSHGEINRGLGLLVYLLKYTQIIKKKYTKNKKKIEKMR